MTNKDWAATSLGVIVGIPRDILKEDYDEFVTREIRVPRDWLTTWGVAFLAIALVLSYQLLAHGCIAVRHTIGAEVASSAAGLRA